MKAALSVALLSVALLAVAAEFRVYPGATAEDFTAWRRRHPNVNVPPGTHVERYSTPDPLDDVVAFYAKIGSESGQEKRLRLATGEEIRMRTFVPWQLVRFAVINLKMLRLIWRGHHQ